MTGPYELDHVFVCVDAGAPEAEALIAFGLTEGSSNTHPGQGTANRRFFFRNAGIELVYVTDAAEAGSEGVRRTGLLRRWQGRRTTASPFGICLRPGPAAPPEPPFPSWAYHPAYAPTPYYLGTNSLRVTEPFLCCIPFSGKPAARRQPLHHAAGFKRITALRIKGPDLLPASAELEAMARTGLVAFSAAETHGMEIGFDGEGAGRSRAFDPVLPLTFCW